MYYRNGGSWGSIVALWLMGTFGRRRWWLDIQLSPFGYAIILYPFLIWLAGLWLNTQHILVKHLVGPAWITVAAVFLTIGFVQQRPGYKQLAIVFLAVLTTALVITVEGLCQGLG